MPRPELGPYVPKNPYSEVVLYDVVKRKEIRVLYMPHSFSETKTANYAQMSILGRSEPILGYSNSGPRTFNINLHFAETSGDPFQDVIKPVRLCRSWLYPDYSDAVLPNLPPRIILAVGQWLVQRCVALRVDVTYSHPWGRAPYADNTLVPATGEISSSFSDSADSMLPYHADVALVLQEVTENGVGPFDHEDVEAGFDVM